jgi:hypothetical protein
MGNKLNAIYVHGHLSQNSNSKLSYAGEYSTRQKYVSIDVTYGESFNAQSLSSLWSVISSGLVHELRHAAQDIDINNYLMMRADPNDDIVAYMLNPYEIDAYVYDRRRRARELLAVIRSLPSQRHLAGLSSKTIESLRRVKKYHGVTSQKVKKLLFYIAVMEMLDEYDVVNTSDRELLASEYTKHSARLHGA